MNTEKNQQMKNQGSAHEGMTQPRVGRAKGCTCLAVCYASAMAIVPGLRVCGTPEHIQLHRYCNTNCVWHYGLIQDTLSSRNSDSMNWLGFKSFRRISPLLSRRGSGRTHQHSGPETNLRVAKLRISFLVFTYFNYLS